MVAKVKNKRHKKCVIKRKLKFKDQKNCLEATELENKTKHQEKNEIDENSRKKDHKEFIRKDSKVRGIMFLLKTLIRLF